MLLGRRSSDALGLAGDTLCSRLGLCRDPFRALPDDTDGLLKGADGAEVPVSDASSSLVDGVDSGEGLVTGSIRVAPVNALRNPCKPRPSTSDVSD